jgi:hypothetical protein
MSYRRSQRNVGRNSARTRAGTGRAAASAPIIAALAAAAEAAAAASQTKKKRKRKAKKKKTDAAASQATTAASQTKKKTRTRAGTGRAASSAPITAALAAAAEAAAAEAAASASQTKKKTKSKAKKKTDATRPKKKFKLARNKRSTVSVVGVDNSDLSATEVLRFRKAPGTHIKYLRYHSYMLYYFKNHRNADVRKIYQSVPGGYTDFVRDFLVTYYDGESAEEIDPDGYYQGKLHYHKLSVEVYKEFLARIRVPKKELDGFSKTKLESGGWSTIQAYNSSLMHVAKHEQDFHFSSKFKDELSAYSLAHKKMLKKKMQAGQRLSHEKAHVPWDLYVYLCKSLTAKETGTRSNIFGRCFLVWTWNLMSRCDSTCELRISHLSAAGDSIVADFKMSKVKNGETSVSEEPKNVFANPFVPSCCAFISLGLWFLLYNGDCNAESKIFPGTNQKSKFSGLLKGIVDTDEGREQLSNAGMSLTDFGCHGLRKGSSTFVCMSSNLCNIVAVSLRASWFMGIHKTYLVSTHMCFVSRASLFSHNYYYVF